MGIFKKCDREGLVRKITNLQKQIDNLRDRVELLEFKEERYKDNRKFYWNGYSFELCSYDHKRVIVKSLSTYEDRIIFVELIIPFGSELKENGDYLECWVNNGEISVLHAVWSIQGYEMIKIDLKMYNRLRELEEKTKEAA